MRTEITAIIICILALAGLIAHSMSHREPVDDRVVPPKEVRIQKSHGTPVMVCRGTVCSFERNGKVIKVRI